MGQVCSFPYGQKLGSHLIASPSLPFPLFPLNSPEKLEKWTHKKKYISEILRDWKVSETKQKQWFGRLVLKF